MGDRLAQRRARQHQQPRPGRTRAQGQFRARAVDRRLACPHRRASLTYGVVHEDGIRCGYHGWKWDFDGNCLEQPAEADNQNFRDRVKQKAGKAEVARPEPARQGAGKRAAADGEAEKKGAESRKAAAAPAGEDAAPAEGAKVLSIDAFRKKT